MAYRLKAGEPVAREVSRNIDKQIQLAIAGLRGLVAHPATRPFTRHAAT